MKALLAKIPRDRSLLLLLAPVLVLVAFLAAGRSEVEYSALPVGVIATSSTTSTTAAPFSPEGAAEQSAEVEVEGSSVSRSGTTTGSGSGGSGSSGSGSRSSSASGSGSSGSGATPTSTPAWVDGATTTVAPGATTTVPGTTTTVPDGGGPDPAVDEVPVAVLLPVTAVLMACLALFVISRRRRVRGS